MIGRVLDEADWPASVVPIVYLSGVSRADLRAIETCPRGLQPLAELQYRGMFWSQINGRDWTVNAFLSSSRGGLNLDVSEDQVTQAAMHRALDALLVTPVDTLKGKRLEATDFDALLSADPVRDLLTWMNDPDGSAADWQGARWEAFRSRCKADWKFDPKADGVLVAAERIAEGQREWETLWQRYGSGWRAFPRVSKQLKLAPIPVKLDLFTDLSRYPKANDEGEEKLRSALARLEGVHHSEAALRLKALEAEHGARRQWLWAEMGQALLAQALEPLARLAVMTHKAFGGQHLSDMTGAYRDEFWKVDAAAREALAGLGSKVDIQVVTAVLRAVYVPWLEDANLRFQDLVRKDGYPGSKVEAASSRFKRQDGASTLKVDLRRKANDPSTSVAVAAKALKDGKASLVVLGAQDQAIARTATVIGGES